VGYLRAQETAALRTPTRTALTSLLIAVAAAGGCSAEHGARPQISVPWGTPGAVAAAQTQARWAYTPSKAAGLTGKVSLPKGQALYFGKRGERWLHDEAAGTLEAAGDLAEQDLVAAARSPSGGFLFVGRGGAMFEAPGPLAAFSRAHVAPEPVARMDGAGSSLLGVTVRGGLLQSQDGGATFARARIDGAPLVGDAALLDGGRGLLLAYPERLFSTLDGGVTWQPLAAPTIGGTEIVRQSEGVLALKGYRSALQIGADLIPRVVRTLPEPDVYELPLALAPSPEASAMREGRGLMRGDEIWVVLRPPGSRRDDPWSLGRARLGERMTSTPLPGTDGCARLAVAADERFLYSACSTSTRGSSMSVIRIRRHPLGDLTQPAEELAAPLEGALGEARIAAGREGKLLVSGACRPGAIRLSCDPDAPLGLSRWEQASEATPEAAASPPGAPAGSASPEVASPWALAAAPAINGRPLAMRFAPSGASAYLLARRGKSNELALFVSHDGGKTFEGHDLGLAGGDLVDRRVVSSVTSASISALDEGTVSAALEGPSGTVLAVADEDGRVLTASSPPASTSATRLGVAGRRALAVDGSRAFESLDGGVSWQGLGEVPALRCERERDQASCDHTVACSAAGCAVGGGVARVGWGGPVELRRATDLDARPMTALPKAPPTPLVCRLGKERWAALARGASIPGAEQADRGKTAWAVAAGDPSKGSVVMVHGLHQPAGKIEEVVLLAPVRDGNTVSVALSATQVEGAAAVRFQRAAGAGAAGAAAPQAARSMEVAWENLFENKLSHATVGDAGPPPAGASVALGRGGFARVGLISISNGGLFVRPQLAHDAPIFFVDHRGKVDRSPFLDFPNRVGDGDDLTAVEAVHEGGRSVPIAFLRNGTGMLRGKLGGRASDIESISLFPHPEAPFAARSQLSFSYLNGAPLLVQTAHFGPTGESVTNIFPFRADGPVLGPLTAGPTQAGVSAHYRPCAAQDRSKTARVVAPAEPGSRRGLLVEGPDGARFAALISEGMVLYGSHDSPCASALEAAPVHEEDTPPAEEHDRALVILSDLEHAWYFRRGANDAVETRSMRCRLDTQAQLPLSVTRVLEGASR
jgi:hypothetical protein